MGDSLRRTNSNLLKKIRDKSRMKPTGALPVQEARLAKVKSTAVLAVQVHAPQPPGQAKSLSPDRGKQPQKVPPPAPAPAPAAAAEPPRKTLIAKIVERCDPRTSVGTKPSSHLNSANAEAILSSTFSPKGITRRLLTKSRSSMIFKQTLSSLLGAEKRQQHQQQPERDKTPDSLLAAKVQPRAPTASKNSRMQTATRPSATTRAGPTSVKSTRRGTNIRSMKASTSSSKLGGSLSLVKSSSDFSIQQTSSLSTHTNIEQILSQDARILANVQTMTNGIKRSGAVTKRRSPSGPRMDTKSSKMTGNTIYANLSPQSIVPHVNTSLSTFGSVKRGATTSYPSQTGRQVSPIAPKPTSITHKTASQEFRSSTASGFSRNVRNRLK
eukprot:TRINITY_DN871_c0_g2_i2.p1 TRINITY_DN871_c0_g2~~TRINITY_DN871_c0_g2_i2.p1  ORF type:complete len:383 (-),score=66.51 TRINITY_DN871_c0_g2_i2:29-1177(-)